MANFMFFTIITIVSIVDQHSKASHCQYFHFLFRVFWSLDYVDQIGSYRATGSESNPYPNISTAINKNQDNFFELSIILFPSSTPYDFLQRDLWPNLNLTLMYFFFSYVFFYYFLESFSFFIIQDSKFKFKTNSTLPKWFSSAQLKRQPFNIA